VIVKFPLVYDASIQLDAPINSCVDLINTWEIASALQYPRGGLVRNQPLGLPGLFFALCKTGTPPQRTLAQVCFRAFNCSMSKLSDYFRLMRISLLPTAWSNVLLGFALTSPDAPSWISLALLLVCSSCLYLSGMVLNDAFDYKLDLTERPERVLPSGKISVRTAKLLGFGLMAIGIAVAAFISIERGKTGLILVRPTLGCAVALAALILYYNLRAKGTILGPVVMGLCRMLNVLLGCSLDKFEYGIWFVPLAIGIYVAGVTWFARDENKTGERPNLLFGAALMTLSAGLLFWYPFTQFFSYNYQLRLLRTPPNHGFLFVGLLAMMLFPVARKVIVAISTKSSSDVKQAVITSLLTIIMIDASICYLALPATPAYALAVATLVIPAYLMSRRIMAT